MMRMMEAREWWCDVPFCFRVAFNVLHFGFPLRAWASLLCRVCFRLLSLFSLALLFSCNFSWRVRAAMPAWCFLIAFMPLSCCLCRLQAAFIFTSLREFRAVLRYVPSDLCVVVDNNGKACVSRGFLKITLKNAAEKVAHRRQQYKVICTCFMKNRTKKDTCSKSRTLTACGAKTSKHECSSTLFSSREITPCQGDLLKKLANKKQKLY